MTLEPILILGVRDIRTALKNRSVSIPMIVVPVVILVIMPVVLLRSLIGAGGEDMLSDLQPLLEGLPPSAVYLAELPLTEAGIILITHYILAPLFLVIPLMVASVLGAESFAGEKERGTLEALLYTPLSRIQLLAWKDTGRSRARDRPSMGQFPCLCDGRQRGCLAGHGPHLLPAFDVVGSDAVGRACCGSSLTGSHGYGLNESEFFHGGIPNRWNGGDPGGGTHVSPGHWCPLPQLAGHAAGGPGIVGNDRCPGPHTGSHAAVR